MSLSTCFLRPNCFLLGILKGGVGPGGKRRQSFEAHHSNAAKDPKWQRLQGACSAQGTARRWRDPPWRRTDRAAHMFLEFFKGLHFIPESVCEGFSVKKQPL